MDAESGDPEDRQRTFTVDERSFSQCRCLDKAHLSAGVRIFTLRYWSDDTGVEDVPTLPRARVSVLRCAPHGVVHVASHGFVKLNGDGRHLNNQSMCQGGCLAIHPNPIRPMSMEWTMQCHLLLTSVSRESNVVVVQSNADMSRAESSTTISGYELGIHKDARGGEHRRCKQGGASRSIGSIERCHALVVNRRHLPKLC